jgi:flagellar biosynthesis protein FlhA
MGGDHQVEATQGGRIMRNSDVLVAALIISVILMIIIPLPPSVIDVMIILNISLSVVILMLTVFNKSTLEFSSFPSVLLMTTVFRIALTISTTRQILTQTDTKPLGDAGYMIDTFGNFVIGGGGGVRTTQMLVLGCVIFLIIVIVQFIVITKGSERVAEVAARFTLDAMPGKQMSIDADLNTGAIDEPTARERRLLIQREADFFGAMDGAAKFVKGEAVVGILIVVVNVVGGFIIGSIMGVENVYTTIIISTIGDGLTNQIPSLLISVSMGMTVTKAGSDNSLGSDVFKQFSAQPKVWFMAAAVLIALSFMPGMPRVTLWMIASFFAFIGFTLHRGVKKVLEAAEEDEEQLEKDAEETRKPENTVARLHIDPMEIEFGYRIIPLADPSQGGDLLDRIVMVRRLCATEMGLVVPTIRCIDNIQMAANQYSIKIKGNPIGGGEIMIGHYLALNQGEAEGEIEGIATTEPTFGQEALWIEEEQREKAELMGYTIIDPPTIIVTHLIELIRRHAHELLGRQQVQVLIDNLRQTQPTLVEEVVPKLFSLGEVQRILANLLREGVSIRDLTTIIEAMGDHGGSTRDPDMLTEYARQALKRSITLKHAPDRNIHVIAVDPQVENIILDNVRHTEHGSYVSIEPDTAQGILNSLRSAIERVTSLGLTPIVLTSPVVRFHFRKLAAQLSPDLVVISYAELEQDVNIQADGVVTVT